MNESNLTKKTILLTLPFDPETTTLSEAKRKVEEYLRSKASSKGGAPQKRKKKQQTVAGGTAAADDDDVVLHLGDASQPLSGKVFVSKTEIRRKSVISPPGSRKASIAVSGGVSSPRKESTLITHEDSITSLGESIANLGTATSKGSNNRKSVVGVLQPPPPTGAVERKKSSAHEGGADENKIWVDSDPTLAALGVEAGRTLFVEFWVTTKSLAPPTPPTTTALADNDDEQQDSSTRRKKGENKNRGGSSPQKGSMEEFLKTGGALYRCALCNGVYCTCLEHLPLALTTSEVVATPTAAAVSVTLPPIHSARGGGEGSTTLTPTVLVVPPEVSPPRALAVRCDPVPPPHSARRTNQAKPKSSVSAMTPADLKSGKLKPFSLPIPKILQGEPTYVRSLASAREINGSGAPAELSGTGSAVSSPRRASSKVNMGSILKRSQVTASGIAPLPPPRTTVMSPRQQQQV